MQWCVFNTSIRLRLTIVGCALLASCGEPSSNAPDGAVPDAGRVTEPDAMVVAVDASLPDAQTSPDASLTDAGPTSYFVGGTADGLGFGGVITLRVNGEESLAVNSDGPFAFSHPFELGDSYEVTIEALPSSPPQNCSIENSLGTVQDNVTDITVNCYQEHRLIVHAFGVEGAGLMLSNTDGQTLAIPSNGTWEFAQAIAPFAAFDVRVGAQPTGPEQTCAVYGGAGYAAMPSHIDTVVVDCADSDIERLLLETDAGVSILRVFPGGITPSPETIIGGVQHPASPLAFFARAGATVFYGVVAQTLLEGSALSTGFTAQPVDNTPADSGHAQGIAYLSSDGAFVIYRQIYFDGEDWTHRLRARGLEAATTTAPEPILECNDDFRCYSFGTAGNNGAWVIRNEPGAFDQTVYFIPRQSGVWGAPIPLTTEQLSYGSQRPIVSNDGRWLVFWGFDGVTHDVWVSAVDVAGPVPVVYPLMSGETEVGAGSVLQLSRNGRWVVYDTGGDIYAADLQAASPEMNLVVSTDSAFIAPILSPTGNQFLYQDEDVLYLHDLAVTSPSTMVGDGRSGTWNESGTAFAYLAPGSTFSREPYVVTDLSVPTPAPLALSEYLRFAGGGTRFVGDEFLGCMERAPDTPELVKWDLGNPSLSPMILAPAIAGRDLMTVANVLKFEDTWFYEHGYGDYWRYDEANDVRSPIPWFGSRVKRVLDRVRRD